MTLNEKRAKKFIPKRRKKPRGGPARDPKYLAWIRTQPCICCWLINRRVEGHQRTTWVESVYTHLSPLPYDTANSHGSRTYWTTRTRTEVV